MFIKSNNVNRSVNFILPARHGSIRSLRDHLPQTVNGWRRLGLVLIFLTLISPTQNLIALIVGSDTAVSRQGVINFPNTDTNNTIVGFAFMNRGFNLQDKTTTCTYDGFFPIGGNITLTGGKLFLNQDLVLNSQATIGSVGRIEGGVKKSALVLPGTDIGGSIPSPVSYLTLTSVYNGILTLGWSYDSQYLAVGTSNGSGAEIYIFSFNGSTLTFITSLEISKSIRCVRWHPNLLYLGVAAESGTGNELFIYSFNGSTLTLTDGVNDGVGVHAISWHPSGNYVVSGRDATGSNELILYSFNTGTGGIVQLAVIDVSPSRSVRDNAMDFSPDGKYLCVGFDSNLLAVYFFNGSSITTAVSVDTGAGNVYGAQWNPTQGDFICVGQQNNPGVAMYEFSRTSSSLLLTDALLRDSNVIDVHWHPSGCFFASCALSSASGGELQIYSFDATSKKFTIIQDIETGDSLFYQHWSPNSLYLASGGSNATPIVWGFRNAGYMDFVDTTVSLRDYTRVGSLWCMYKNCRINGNGQVLDFGQQSSCELQVGKIQARRGARLVFEDVIIRNLERDRIHCLTNDAVITFSNCRLQLSGEYTFSTGAAIFSGDVVITGTNPFTYSSSVAGVISSQSTLMFDQGTTFKYAPVVGNKNLFRMAGETAELYLNNCTLQTTRTGLQLSNGTLTLDNKVTITSGALNSAESIEFTPSLNINILSFAQVDMYGFIRVQ